MFTCMQVCRLEALHPTHAHMYRSLLDAAVRYAHALDALYRSQPWLDVSSTAHAEAQTVLQLAPLVEEALGL